MTQPFYLDQVSSLTFAGIPSFEKIGQWLESFQVLVYGVRVKVLRDTLTDLLNFTKTIKCPEYAHIISDVNETREKETAWLMIAEVKGAERIREKIKEAAAEHGHDAKMWPYIQMIGKRATCGPIRSG